MAKTEKKDKNSKKDQKKETKKAKKEGKDMWRPAAPGFGPSALALGEADATMKCWGLPCTPPACDQSWMFGEHLATHGRNEEWPPDAAVDSARFSAGYMMFYG